MTDDRAKITSDQIQSLYRRGFGASLNEDELRELGGGTHNQAFTISPTHGERVVLRIAPAEDENTYLDDRLLMRREHAIQPFFAPLSTLMPRILLVDFTHQLIDRDYMFQSFIEGERWDDVEGELTDDQNLELWRQFGEIQRTIHDVFGEEFGWPHPGQRYASWYDLLVDRFEHLVAEMAANNLETDGMAVALQFVRSNRDLLDAVDRPRLLHGDLWLFNLLVDRDAMQIVGVLDADRASWGDPLADWAIFGLVIRDGNPEWDAWRGAFFDGYGSLPEDAATQRRIAVYKAMQLGAVSLWSLREQNPEDVQRACTEIARIAAALK